MVGTIIFKNFETGSYRELTLTAYDGKNYAHIGSGSFFSCRVCPEDKSICYEYIPENDVDFRNMDDILFVAQKARVYLAGNTHITIAEFIFDGTECHFRPKSFTCGTYEPVEFRSLFSDDGFYVLLSQHKDKSPMWLSLFCEVINFAVHKNLSISASVFGFSGYGVYINAALFKNRLSVFNLTPELKKRIKNKKAPSVRLISHKFDALETSGEKPSSVAEKLLERFSGIKCRLANSFAETLRNCNREESVLKAVLSLGEDCITTELIDEYEKDLKDFARFTFDYGYVSAASHVSMLTLKEVMMLNLGFDDKKDTEPIARSRSVNRKYIDSLPCVPYYDSDGSAFWE